MLLIIHLFSAAVTLGGIGAAIIAKIFSFNIPHSRLAALSLFGYGGVLVTGSLMVVQSRAPLVSACISGLILTGAFAALYAWYGKLAAIKL